jgi:hypothetical protein
MELEDIRLDDETFREITRSCNLEQHWRPQVRLPIPAQRPSRVHLHFGYSVRIQRCQKFSAFKAVPPSGLRYRVRVSDAVFSAVEAVSGAHGQPAEHLGVIPCDRYRSTTSWA